MKHIRSMLHSEAVKVPLLTLTAAGGGFLLSLGTISGVASSLAAALAGICPPLYAFAILCGSLVAYTVTDAPQGMHYLLCCLVAVTCCRILFRETFRAHVLSVMTAVCCMAAGFALDVVFYGGSGHLPLYILEALLTGTASFFLGDAAQALRDRRRIALQPGRSFTFAICYLLGITALCGLDLSFCNIGRIVGTAATLLCARQTRQQGGTLCGALTACGVTLCSVKLGMPVLFLPVTAMLMGYLAKLPNALFIPAFFIMQTLSSAVLDSSVELARVVVELLLSCTLYALCSHVEMYSFLLTEQVQEGGSLYRERFLSSALHELQEEASAVMHRLTIPEPEDAAVQLQRKVCVGCKNYDHCWKLRADLTRRAVLRMMHTPWQNPLPPALESCVRRNRLAGAMAECTRNNALQQMQRVNMMQNRSVTLAYLQLLENMACDGVKRRQGVQCASETEALRRILRQCDCEDAHGTVSRLRSGRYAAEIYTRKPDFPLSSVMKALSARLDVTLGSMESRQQNGSRICLYEVPIYSLEYDIHSVNAPAYERCGDQTDAFTDGVGNQYLVLSDGMGSGSTASLASRIAVRTLRRMIGSDMPPETAIRLVNTLLLSETNTENFATLDVLILDVDSGELTLYKSGAAATLLCRQGKVHRIISQSFPVGIVPDALPSRKHMTALAGDCIVMLSDGIGEGEYPYIRQLLLQGMPLSDVTRTVCEKATVFLGAAPRDDMTVIAARVCAQNSAELTKIVEQSAYKSSQIAVEAVQ